MTRPAYDTIGAEYNANRTADPRILARLVELLGLPAGARVADIGAGTGNYTNALADQGYRMTAIEPSEVMRNQATPHADVTWLAGAAEAIPLPDASVDAVVSTLAAHHFASLPDAAAEMRRICPAGPVVLFTMDPRQSAPFWFEGYFPGIYRRMFDVFPPIAEVADLLAAAGSRSSTMHDFPLPHDLADRNMHSGWNRPEYYLDEQARANTSGFAQGDPAEITDGLARLQADLESGAWDERHGALRTRESFDAGFRFIRCAT